MSAAQIPPPRLIAWETTRACNLVCRHCRASAILEPPRGELSPEEGRNLLEQVAAWPPSPMVILSGGEPLLRGDIYSLAAYGTSLGLRMLLSTNGALVDKLAAKEMLACGIARVSLSLDGPDAFSHDEFRGQTGSFAQVEQAAAYFREVGLPFQINSTLTADNLAQVEAMTNLAVQWGAQAHHVFLLVPVGRAKDMGPPLSPMEYEKALTEICRREKTLPLEFKATCAPQYNRITREMKAVVPRGRGCLAGQGFAFISSTGQVRGCGYLTLPAGELRQESLRQIYEESPLFVSLRKRELYKDPCGTCSYWSVCGGCRARAEANGDHLGPEPLCPRIETTNDHAE